MCIRDSGIAVFVAVGLTGLSAQQAPAPGAAAGAGGGARGAAPQPQIVWSPKATKPGDWTPPHKPHTKLVDLLARHKGKADWVETVVDDDTLHADYISAAPGSKTPRRMLSLIHISEPTRQAEISYAVFCLKKKK